MGVIPGMPQLASSMMRKQVEEANIPENPAMQMMKIKKEELLDGVTVMTAEQFLKEAADCQFNMFT